VTIAAMKLLLALVLLSVSACPKPTPDGGVVQGVIHCGSQAVQSCAGGALPAVNQCLTGTGDVTGCLLGLIQPAGCITYQVVACLTRHEGSAAARAAELNPADTRDAWRAARAKEFLERTGAKFGE
jgi:hypothetical protein